MGLLHSMYRFYPLSDSTCSSSLSDIMSYVAYKEDFCYNVEIVTGGYYYGYEYVDVSYKYTAESDGSIVGSITLGSGCLEPIVDNVTYAANDCVLPTDGPHAQVEAIKQSTIAHLETTKNMMTRDMMRESQDEKIYQKYMEFKHGKPAKQDIERIQKKIRKDMHVNSESSYYSTESWNDTVYFGSGESSYYYYYSYYSYGAEFEVFARWHDYAYEWMNFPHIGPSAHPTRPPTPAPTQSQVYEISVTQVSNSSILSDN